MPDSKFPDTIKSKLAYVLGVVEALGHHPTFGPYEEPALVTRCRQRLEEVNAELDSFAKKVSE
jgi:hypothetical protein